MKTWSREEAEILSHCMGEKSLGMQRLEMKILLQFTQNKNLNLDLCVPWWHLNHKPGRQGGKSSVFLIFQMVRHLCLCRKKQLRTGKGFVKWGWHPLPEDFPAAEHLLLALCAETSPLPAAMGSERVGSSASDQLLIRQQQDLNLGFPLYRQWSQSLPFHIDSVNSASVFIRNTQQPNKPVC